VRCLNSTVTEPGAGERRDTMVGHRCITDQRIIANDGGGASS
jgi:hypothetical protein